MMMTAAVMVPVAVTPVLVLALPRVNAAGRPNDSVGVEFRAGRTLAAPSCSGVGTWGGYTRAIADDGLNARPWRLGSTDSFLWRNGSGAFTPPAVGGGFSFGIGRRRVLPSSYNACIRAWGCAPAFAHDSLNFRRWCLARSDSVLARNDSGAFAPRAVGGGVRFRIRGDRAFSSSHEAGYRRRRRLDTLAHNAVGLSDW